MLGFEDCKWREREPRLVKFDCSPRDIAILTKIGAVLRVRVRFGNAIGFFGCSRGTWLVYVLEELVSMN